MKLFVVLGLLNLLAGVTDAGVSMDNPFFCYSTDPIRSMTHMASSITSYEAFRRFNFTTVDRSISPGTPTRFWYLGRYTNRFAALEFMEGMNDFAQSSAQDNIVSNYEAGRTTLCRPDFEAIRNFSLDTYFENEFSLDKALSMMESGFIATRNIASRYQEILPNILTQNYSPDRFHFRHNYYDYANATIRAFASGLFGEAESQNVIYEDIPEVDWFLRPFNFCPAFIEERGDYYTERYAFTRGPEMEKMIQQVNRKLGLHSSNQLNYDQILSMWNLCRFKIAETFETSNSEIGGNATWCAPFSVGHHLLFQYMEDLSYFYLAGYGVNNRLRENLSCGLMQDLLTHMQSNNNTDQMTRIFISQNEAVLILLGTLGRLGDMWPLHRHNFATQTNRNFLTSFLIPFSGHIAVIRYDHDDGDHDLIFLQNERPLILPGCDQQTGICKLSVFVNRFRRFIGVNCEDFYCSDD